MIPNTKLHIRNNQVKVKKIKKKCLLKFARFKNKLLTGPSNGFSAKRNKKENVKMPFRTISDQKVPFCLPKPKDKTNYVVQGPTYSLALYSRVFFLFVTDAL